VIAQEDTMKITFSKSEWEAMGKQSDSPRVVITAIRKPAVITPEIQAKLDNMDLSDMILVCNTWGIWAPPNYTEDMLRLAITSKVEDETIPGYALPN